MNTKQLVIAISLLSAIGTASAQQNASLPNMGYFDASPVTQTANEPGKTRAQVVAELKDAQEHGLVDHLGFLGGEPAEGSKSAAPGKTRAQVVAELKAAQKQGLVDNNGFVPAPVTTQNTVSAPVQVGAH